MSGKHTGENDMNSESVIITVRQTGFHSDDAQRTIEQWEERRSEQGRLSCAYNDEVLLNALTDDATDFCFELRKLFPHCSFGIQSPLIPLIPSEPTEFEKAQKHWDNYVAWKNEWLKAINTNRQYMRTSPWTRHCNDMFLKAKARYDACLISHADIKVITEGWQEKMYAGVA